MGLRICIEKGEEIPAAVAEAETLPERSDREGRPGHGEAGSGDMFYGKRAAYLSFLLFVIRVVGKYNKVQFAYH
jgi:hypothetical protein